MVETSWTRGPIATINSVVEQFFSIGTVLASLRYHIAIQAIKMPLTAIVRSGPTSSPPSLPSDAELRAIFLSEKDDQEFLNLIAMQYPWESSATAAEFIAILCTDLEDIDARVRAATFNCPSLTRSPTLTQIRMEPPASLVSALSTAIAVQKGGDAGRAVHGGRTLPPSSTCLVVSLTDCAIHKAAEQFNQSVVHYTSYGHNFALLVDANGVGLYQAWGNGLLAHNTTTGGLSSSLNSSCRSIGGAGANAAFAAPAAFTGNTLSGATCSPASDHHFTLGDWIRRRRTSKPMSYVRALEWARAFEEFCERITWDETTNGLYAKLFGVDMAALAAATGLPPPARIKSWVRILEIPGVTEERIAENARFFL